MGLLEMLLWIILGWTLLCTLTSTLFVNWGNGSSDPPRFMYALYFPIIALFGIALFGEIIHMKIKGTY